MLSLALKKSKFTLFSNSHRIIDNLCLDLVEHKIGLEDNIAYLGKRLNRKPNWANHIAARCTKAKRIIENYSSERE